MVSIPGHEFLVAEKANHLIILAFWPQTVVAAFNEG